MVQFSDAPIIVIEGDEYFTSAMDKRPKFFHYKPQIALITGIAWDHFNVFPTYRSYTDQFKRLIESMSAESFLIVNEEDNALKDLVSETESKASVIYYKPLPYQYADSGTLINLDDSSYTVKVFGRHNISNMCGALEVCKCLGLSEHDFLASMSDFEGASKRLERIDSSRTETVYRDFAHAPSKVKASVEAVAEMHPDKTINAILELHTFSSLNKDFLPQYSGTMDAIDNSVVFFNPETLKRKGLPPLDKEFIIESFKHQNLKVIDNTEELNQYLRSNKTDVLLLMSSGNFGNLAFEGLI
jgi:UDP-N-acetylmuramate-alanine ligase